MASFESFSKCFTPTFLNHFLCQLSSTLPYERILLWLVFRTLHPMFQSCFGNLWLGIFLFLWFTCILIAWLVSLWVEQLFVIAWQDRMLRILPPIGLSLIFGQVNHKDVDNYKCGFGILLKGDCINITPYLKSHGWRLGMEGKCTNWAFRAINYVVESHQYCSRIHDSNKGSPRFIWASKQAYPDQWLPYINWSYTLYNGDIKSH